MKSYVPNTVSEREKMLSLVGVSSMDELYCDVPASMKLKSGLNLPDGLSEMEVRRIFIELAKKNNNDLKIFRGAGAYNHYIPSVVTQLSQRSEFYTAYTPYQAEMSQGMLQAIFEYQTLICRLTGMDVSNASVYDGATAAAEAMSMMTGSRRKHKILLSAGLHPEIIETVKTYAHCAGTEVVIIPIDKNGVTDIDYIKNNKDCFSDAAGIIAQSPNFYGCIEDLTVLSSVMHEQNLMVCAYVNPLSLGLLKRPADCGCDIAIGDCQPLGLPLSFGGPYAGFMACTSKLIRNLPGRITGQTEDKDGNRAFVLTLQAREQHIRRDKASSNICSNQMLCAIMSSIYVSCMGKEGMREVAEQNVQKAHYLADGLSQIKGIHIRYNAPFFNEFVIDTEKASEEVNNALKAKGFMGGLPLSRLIPGEKGMLWCVTECNSRTEIDELLNSIAEVLA